MPRPLPAVAAVQPVVVINDKCRCVRVPSCARRRDRSSRCASAALHQRARSATYTGWEKARHDALCVGRCTTLRFTALTYDAMTAVSISNKAKEEEEVEKATQVLKRVRARMGAPWANKGCWSRTSTSTPWVYIYTPRWRFRGSFLLLSSAQMRITLLVDLTETVNQNPTSFQFAL